MKNVKGSPMPKTHSSPDPKKPAGQGKHKGAPTQSPYGSGKPTGGRGASGKVNSQAYLGTKPSPKGGSGAGPHKGSSLPRS